MKIHVVKKGEVLGDIAHRYGLDENSLRLANSLSVPGPLSAGQSLFIPGDLPGNKSSLECCAFISGPAESRAFKAFTYLCPYSHSFDELGALTAPDFVWDTEAMRHEGCAPLLCLTNIGRHGGFSPELAHHIFSHAEARAQLFDMLLSTLKADKYYGLQLCFNYLFPFDRDNYSNFVLELSELLHREGFMLSVELVPPDSAALSSALDYRALDRAADRLSLMFCRWGHSFSPPQPLAPLPYIRRGLDELDSLVARDKLLLGISGCGFDWQLPWRQGDSARQLSNPLAAELAMARGAEIKYDVRAQAPYFDYKDAAQRRHRLYFEDARSIGAKLRLVEEYSLAGISLYSWEKALRPGSVVLESLYSAEKLL